MTLLLAGLLLLPAPGARAASTDTLSGVPARDRELIQEMRLRLILTGKQTRYSPEEYTLLLRVREAEALGAFDFIRGKLGTLRGFVAARKEAGGDKKLLLTGPGYERYRFLKSQDARSYFEGKGIPAYAVFDTADPRGRRFFNAGGLLTQEGEEAYNRVQRGLPVFWRHPDGRVDGNVRPPKDIASGPTPAAPAGPSHAQLEAEAERQVLSLVNSGYVQLTEAEYRHLLASSQRTEEQLRRESSLQALKTSQKTFYLLSPSDPLMAEVARYRSGGR